MKKIRQYVIGYCDGESVMCKPKKNTMAVMFLVDGDTFWTHLSVNEFNTIFKELKCKH